MARLLSVNVGLPRDIAWRAAPYTPEFGRSRSPVVARFAASILRVTAKGISPAMAASSARLRHQIESHRYWQDQLQTTYVLGQFGENFTVEDLPDDKVCIGDRFQIGSALFEVTQPRVTCYRLGIRTDEPRMAAMLTSSGRPGFYFRVLREGEVGAGDDIVKVGEASERMTVAEINALLYFPPHPRELLERALRIEALSPGWHRAFDDLLRSQSNGGRSGNAGLNAAASAHPAAPGFSRLEVTAIDRELADVLSLTMRSPDGQALPAALPGQYVVLRLPPAGGAPWFRSYSLSGLPSTDRYRISVKFEPNGAGGSYLHREVHVGDMLDVSAPRGNFVLQEGQRPVVLLSAGIGATPVLAMLHALAAARSARQVLWLHAARDRQHHPFVAEIRSLMPALANGRIYVCYSRPGSQDKPGEDFDASGHLSRSVFDAVGFPREADVYICGPAAFMTDMKQALAAIGVTPKQIHLELFNGSESRTPGVVGATMRAAHVPEDDADTGPLVSFARSGIAAHWKPSYQSILELAEACDVPVRWACRTGVCHNCESGLVSGAVAYAPQPLDRPADGNLLICCSQPAGDVVIDL